MVMSLQCCASIARCRMKFIATNLHDSMQRAGRCYFGNSQAQLVQW